MKCRFCNSPLQHEFINLGCSPPSNSFLSRKQLDEPELFYPLKLFACDRCFLVQIPEHKKASEIFNEEYVYFSSCSTSWVEHAKRYAELITDRLSLNSSSRVVEVASNDGYLLQFFKEKGIPCLGIEPAKNTAEASRKKGIEVITEFFGVKLAETIAGKGWKADLLIGNNVLAHVPDMNDFIKGLKVALKDDGMITMEFPYLLEMIENNQFDTIYHEHYSYFSLFAVNSIFLFHGLEIVDVEKIKTHGNSLRIYARHEEKKNRSVSASVSDLLEKEISEGITRIEFYKGFQERADRIRQGLLTLLIGLKQSGKKVSAYGAAAKGNTLLNYSGVRKDLLPFVADISPMKQGKYLPGSHIPVVHEDEIRRTKPDYLLILPWNIKDEIIKQLDYIREWGCKFITVIPTLNIL